MQELVPIAYELKVDPCALLDDPEAKITAAMAQLRTATTGIARCDGQMAELEEQERTTTPWQQKPHASSVPQEMSMAVGTGKPPTAAVACSFLKAPRCPPKPSRGHPPPRKNGASVL